MDAVGKMQKASGTKSPEGVSKMQDGQKYGFENGGPKGQPNYSNGQHLPSGGVYYPLTGESASGIFQQQHHHHSFYDARFPAGGPPPGFVEPFSQFSADIPPGYHGNVGHHPGSKNWPGATHMGGSRNSQFFSNGGPVPSEHHLFGQYLYHCDLAGNENRAPEPIQHNSHLNDDYGNARFGSRQGQPRQSGESICKPVIEPIINNIVGSMSSSADGTYSHFGHYGGPSLMSTVGKSDPVVVEDKPIPINKKEFARTVKKVPVQKLVIEKEDVTEKAAPAVVEPKVVEDGRPSQPGRSITPKEGTESRPHTPGKRSYLEVLCQQEHHGNKSGGNLPKSAAQTSSNPPSPSTVLGSTSNHPSLVRRASTGHFHGLDSSKDPLHSNASSASSSPLIPPKKMEDRRCSKGKENTANSSSSRNSTAKNSPSVTPKHLSSGSNVVPQPATKGSRKILNSTIQNNQPGLSNGTDRSFGKIPGAPKSRGFSFGFDIHDVDDDDDEDDDDSNAVEIVKEGVRKSSLYGDEKSKAMDLKQRNFSEPAHSKPYLNGSGSYDRKGPPSSTGNASKASYSRMNCKSEKSRHRRGGRPCAIERLRLWGYVWLNHLMLAVNWLWSLVTDVGTLSGNLALTLTQDFYRWWRVTIVPSFYTKITDVQEKWKNLWIKVKMKLWWTQEDISSSDKPAAPKRDHSDILAMMGPEKNIVLPSSGEEALKRLLSVKGQDPYSILGIRSDSTDETVRRYYKKQAVLVHPDKNVVAGAEEGFKILQRAFELIGEPEKRIDYHKQILEAHEKERVFGEIGNLLEQLRKKMEIVTNSIRCTKCNARHKKYKTERPLYAARFCAQCRINHAAREGDLWAERRGLFGMSRQFFACMEGSVWEINEWASCQKQNLKHLQPDSHNIMYRLVAGMKACSGGVPTSHTCGHGKHGRSFSCANMCSDPNCKR